MWRYCRLIVNKCVGNPAVSWFHVKSVSLVILYLKILYFNKVAQYGYLPQCFYHKFTLRDSFPMNMTSSIATGSTPPPSLSLGVPPVPY